MMSLIIAILGAIPVIGPIIKRWSENRALANRPDLVERETAQQVQINKDSTNAEIGDALHSGDKKKQEAALAELRRRAAE